MFGIKPGRLEPGMILARPILLKNGMVLFGEGTELTETYIERIRAMALSCIYVAGDAPLTESRQELLEKLNSRFRGVEQKPYMMLLKRLVEEHLSELYK